MSTKRLRHWQATMVSVHETIISLPPELRAHFVKASDELCDIGDRLEIDPKTMAVAASLIIGTLALAYTQGNVHADEAIDEFIEHCHAAMHVAVAAARVNAGWTPNLS